MSMTRWSAIAAGVGRQPGMRRSTGNSCSSGGASSSGPGGTSQHLTAMRRQGILESRKAGTNVYYRVKDPACSICSQSPARSSRRGSKRAARCSATSPRRLPTRDKRAESKAGSTPGRRPGRERSRRRPSRLRRVLPAIAGWGPRGTSAALRRDDQQRAGGLAHEFGRGRAEQDTLPFRRHLVDRSGGTSVSGTDRRTCIHRSAPARRQHKRSASRDPSCRRAQTDPGLRSRPRPTSLPAKYERVGAQPGTRLQRPPVSPERRTHVSVPLPDAGRRTPQCVSSSPGPAEGTHEAVHADFPSRRQMPHLDEAVAAVGEMRTHPAPAIREGPVQTGPLWFLGWCWGLWGNGWGNVRCAAESRRSPWAYRMRRGSATAPAEGSGTWVPSDRVRK